MPILQRVHIGVGDIGLTTADGEVIRLAQLPPVQLVVLMRHRH